MPNIQQLKNLTPHTSTVRRSRTTRPQIKHQYYQLPKGNKTLQPNIIKINNLNYLAIFVN